MSAAQQHSGGLDQVTPQDGERPAPAPFVTTPNAERYLLEADSLRRRQLRSALLHGSTRVWRERRRIWPAALSGLVVVAVVVAAIAVYGAFQRQQRITEEEQRRRQPVPVVTSPSPKSPSARPR
ncbi:MAG TPA: hypothetical protein VFB84_16480 [Micromonosporaceae bacterium]|nr:hypothetical protein [Micromonosporaceae bacterium]